MFDAFFTTKTHGTGLGLSIVHRIVADHGGTIRVESHPGRTCFTLALPAAASEQVGQRAQPVDRREHAHDVVTLDHDRRTDLEPRHVGHDGRELGVRGRDVDVRHHRVLDRQLLRSRQRADHFQLPLRDDADQLAPVQHRQMAHVTLVHQLLGGGERLLAADRVRPGRHVLRNCGAHFSPPATGSRVDLGAPSYSCSLYWILRTLIPRISAAWLVDPPVDSSVLGSRSARSRPWWRPGSAGAERPSPGLRRGQLGRRDPLPLREHDRALDDVLELAHVARPVVARQPLQRVVGEAVDLACRSPRRTVRRKCSASSGTSARRARSGGSSMVTTLSR